mmetsp:Transcript_13979/g.24003  ORF Transcript_13979/g.24003 Transcript_13979/m.24003 type:complete len:210 (+) Transcript_13979:124-753(+)
MSGTSFLSEALLLSHVVPYLTIPLEMLCLWRCRHGMKRKRVSHLLVQAALAMFLCAMAAELLWHNFVQHWEYKNETHWLRNLFYCSLTMASFLLCVSFRGDPELDVLLGGLVVATPFVYSMQMKSALWIILILLNFFVCWRASEVLQTRLAFLFLFFSCFVNLFFLSLLFHTWNPVFHIAQDLLGTWAGLEIFVRLICWRCAPLQQTAK